MVAIAYICQEIFFNLKTKMLWLIQQDKQAALPAAEAVLPGQGPRAAVLHVPQQF